MVRNFLFHRVNPKRDKLWDPMDVKLFDHCLRYISRNYHIIQLEEFVLDNKSVLAKKNFATVLFDDGYKDNIEYALPVLDKYKIKASFYVITDCIEKNIPPWTYILDHSFQITQKNKIDLRYDFLPESLRVTNLKGTSERIEYVRKLKPALKKLKHEERLEVIQAVRHFFDDVEFSDLMMNWRDLEALQINGHVIGSHTVSHCMLGTMSNEEEIKMELSNSAQMICDRLGTFPVTISYPVGSYNDNTKRLSREVGYKIGLAVNQKVYDPELHDVFEIPRIELYNETWLKTRLRIDNVIGRVSKLLGRP